MRQTYKRSENVVAVEPEEGKKVLLNTATGQYHGLNDTATLLWDHMDTATEVSELAQVLVGTYQLDLDTAVADTLALMEGLTNRGVVICESPDSQE